MLESQKDMLLKGVCCLMLLQINGEAKGHTQIYPAQKSVSRLENGNPIDFQIQIMQKEALPPKNEIVVESDGKVSGGYLKSPVIQKKKGKRAFSMPFIQRKMNMHSAGTGKKTSKKVTVSNTWKQSAPAFQWKRVSAQRGGRAVINRSILNRNCMAHFQMENDG